MNAIDDIAFRWSYFSSDFHLAKALFLFPMLGFTEETKNQPTTFQSGSKFDRSHRDSPAIVKTDAITVAAVSIR